MRKLIIPIFVACLSVSFTILPTAQHKNNPSIVLPFTTVNTANNNVVSEEAATLYNTIGLDAYGLSQDAFAYAYRGYEYLLSKNKITRTEYLTICDFSQSSRQKRFYIIDLANNKIVTNTYVAHGRNSGAEYATHFSNKPESLESSLGFYITRGTYIGEHGLSLKIDGVDNGYNNNAMSRNIVIHGAAYVGEDRARSGMYMGRSWGCPAVSQKESATIITTIKNGTCLFIYHPDRSYLKGSKILNG